MTEYPGDSAANEKRARAARAHPHTGILSKNIAIIVHDISGRGIFYSKTTRGATAHINS
jgi:hypothetical protein